jgi:hypothetical protein
MVTITIAKYKADFGQIAFSKTTQCILGNKAPHRAQKEQEIKPGRD